MRILNKKGYHKCLGVHMLLDHVHIVYTQHAYMCNGRRRLCTIQNKNINTYVCQKNSTVQLISVGIAHAHPIKHVVTMPVD